MMAIKWARVPGVLSLPALAIPAAYGVYSFQVLFAAPWVALVSAAAFELVYMALALVDSQDERRRKVIAATAVAVSIGYNSLSGLFHIRPGILLDRPLWADIALAILHGLPLALLAYNVAILLLHPGDRQESPAKVEKPVESPIPAPAAPIPAPIPAPAALPAPIPDDPPVEGAGIIGADVGDKRGLIRSLLAQGWNVNAIKGAIKGRNEEIGDLIREIRGEMA